MPLPTSKTLSAISTAAIVVGCLLSVCGVLVTLGHDCAILADAAKCLQDHETRLRAIERDLPTIAADVRWIRTTIQKGTGARDQGPGKSLAILTTDP